MEARQQAVTVWQGRVPFRVLVKGEGPAVVFLHGPWGLTWGPFLDALAERFRVYAPEHPGTTPGAPDVVHEIDGLWDLVLCYDELLEGLGLSEATLVGHSFGAMMACEVAAQRPARVRRLALLDPIGLWRDDAPVVNWMLLGPTEMPAHARKCIPTSACAGTRSSPRKTRIACGTAWNQVAVCSSANASATMWNAISSGDCKVSTKSSNAASPSCTSLTSTSSTTV